MPPLWRHFALLLFLGALFVYLVDLLTGAPIRAGGWSGAPLEAMRSLPHALHLVVPVAAGVAVGTLRPEQRAVRVAWRVAAAATVLMLLLDALAYTAGNHTDTMLGNAGIALGDIAGTRVMLQQYPVGHPRSSATDAMIRGGMLLLPAILVGLVMGLVVWVRDRVIFRARRDEQVAHWILAWLLVPPVTAFVISWSSGYAADVLFRGESLLLVLVPYVPATAVAIVGWRRAVVPAGDGARATNVAA